MRTYFEWTDASEAYLQECMDKGYTTTQMVAALGVKYKYAFTRNAVIGKAWRLRKDKMSAHKIDGVRRKRRVQRPAVKVGAAAPRAPRVTPARQEPAVVGPSVEPRVEVASEQPVIAAKGRTCQFITGDAKDRDFCSNPVHYNPDAGAGCLSWCHEHLSVVFEKGSKKSRSEKSWKYATRYSNHS